MSELPCYETRMGHTFYERTVPELVRQLARLNDLLERLVERLPAAVGDDTREAPPERSEEPR